MYLYHAPFLFSIWQINVSQSSIKVCLLAVAPCKGNIIKKKFLKEENAGENPTFLKMGLAKKKKGKTNL